MLVDDSAVVRNILKTALISSFNILEGANGREGLDLALENRVDLFILDVNMPVMDGITLVRKLRAEADYKNTPIIMLTTESRDSKIKEGKEAGATGWVVKPCDTEKLTNLINKII